MTRWRTPTYTLAQLTQEFGEEIALLVDGCTKLDKVKYGESAKSETIRRWWSR
jgi:GTP pyrophosphokinase